MKITDTHIFFYGSIFSNFFFLPITYKGNRFPTTEHAFMWEKANKFGQEKIANQIKQIPHPSGAKALGRKIPNFDKDFWDKISYDIMVEVNRPKWIKLKSVLELTENKIIVEASPYDKIWGVGLDQTNPKILYESNWKGKNLLGKVIMQLRRENKLENHFIDPLNI